MPINLTDSVEGKAVEEWVAVKTIFIDVQH